MRKKTKESCGRVPPKHSSGKRRGDVEPDCSLQKPAMEETPGIHDTPEPQRTLGIQKTPGPQNTNIQTPDPQKTPDHQATPAPPGTPEPLTIPNIQETLSHQNTPGSQKTPDVQETPDLQMMPALLQTSGPLNTPDIQKTLSQQKIPDIQEKPDHQATSAPLQTPGTLKIPDIEEALSPQKSPDFKKTPDIQETPDHQVAPAPLQVLGPLKIPEMQETPSPQKTPDVQGTPDHKVTTTPLQTLGLLMTPDIQETPSPQKTPGSQKIPGSQRTPRLGTQQSESPEKSYSSQLRIPQCDDNVPVSWMTPTDKRTEAGHLLESPPLPSTAVLIPCHQGEPYEMNGMCNSAALETSIIDIIGSSLPEPDTQCRHHLNLPECDTSELCPVITDKSESPDLNRSLVRAKSFDRVEEEKRTNNEATSSSGKSEDIKAMFLDDTRDAIVACTPTSVVIKDGSFPEDPPSASPEFKVGFLKIPPTDHGTGNANSDFKTVEGQNSMRMTHVSHLDKENLQVRDEDVFQDQKPSMSPRMAEGQNSKMMTHVSYLAKEDPQIRGVDVFQDQKPLEPSMSPRMAEGQNSTRMTHVFHLAKEDPQVRGVDVFQDQKPLEPSMSPRMAEGQNSTRMTCVFHLDKEDLQVRDEDIFQKPSMSPRMADQGTKRCPLGGKQDVPLQDAETERTGGAETIQELADSQLLGALEESLCRLDKNVGDTIAAVPVTPTSSVQRRPPHKAQHTNLLSNGPSAATSGGREERRGEDASSTVQGLISELSNLNRLIMSTYRELRQKRTRFTPGRGAGGKRRREM